MQSDFFPQRLSPAKRAVEYFLEKARHGSTSFIDSADVDSTCDAYDELTHMCKHCHKTGGDNHTEAHANERML